MNPAEDIPRSANLTGKTVLFFGPETFNYETEIVQELGRRGAKAIYRSDKPDNSLLTKVGLRLFPKLMWRWAEKVYVDWLAKNAPVRCDLVLVIKGEGLSPRFLDHLKLKYPDAVFIYYLWDSLKNVRFAEQKFPKFDRVLSFDPEDCARIPSLTYRPLFYLEKYRNASNWASSIHGGSCFFVGTLNGDRPAVLARLVRALEVRKIHFDYWLFVRSQLELRMRCVVDSQLRMLAPQRLISKAMSSSEVSERFQQSTAILDIEHPQQVGLTMRTFEVLASGKKLITTNKTILKHDFYDPTRILVIDRHTPVVPSEFFDAQPEPLPQSFFDNNSISGWLSEILPNSQFVKVLK